MTIQYKIIDNQLTTSDYGLANWLDFNGLLFLGTYELPNEPRKSFVFQTDPNEAMALIEEWVAADSMEADICRRFFKSHSAIKRALKESYRVSK